jgi:hypothetical protein
MNSCINDHLYTFKLAVIQGASAFSLELQPL